jgi:hypothetical protein
MPTRKNDRRLISQIELIKANDAMQRKWRHWFGAMVIRRRHLFAPFRILSTTRFSFSRQIKFYPLLNRSASYPQQSFVFAPFIKRTLSAPFGSMGLVPLAFFSR